MEFLRGLWTAGVQDNVVGWVITGGATLVLLGLLALFKKARAALKGLCVGVWQTLLIKVAVPGWLLVLLIAVIVVIVLPGIMEPYRWYISMGALVILVVTLLFEAVWGESDQPASSAPIIPKEALDILNLFLQSDRADQRATIPMISNALHLDIHLTTHHVEQLLLRGLLKDHPLYSEWEYSLSGAGRALILRATGRA